LMENDSDDNPKEEDTMMTTFLNKVKRATTAMGKAPYDDKKTTAYALEVSRRTSELCDKLRAKNNLNKMLKNANLPLSKH